MCDLRIHALIQYPHRTTLHHIACMLRLSYDSCYVDKSVRHSYDYRKVGVSMTYMPLRLPLIIAIPWANGKHNVATIMQRRPIAVTGIACQADDRLYTKKPHAYVERLSTLNRGPTQYDHRVCRPRRPSRPCRRRPLPYQPTVPSHGPPSPATMIELRFPNPGSPLLRC